MQALLRWFLHHLRGRMPEMNPGVYFQGSRVVSFQATAA